MRLLLFAAATLAGGISASSKDQTHLVVGGNTFGYLSPCGCTKPMSGGIRRMATAIQGIGSKENRFVAFVGPFTSQVGRQSELKVETQSESFQAMGADAVGVSSKDALLGHGALLALAQLSGGRAVASNLAASPTNPFLDEVVKRGVRFLSLTENAALLAQTVREGNLSDGEAISRALQDSDDGNALIVSIDGGLERARSLARAHPSIDLVLYASVGNPPKTVLKEGNTLLASPGEKGKHLLKFKVADGRVTDYAPIDLGPEYPDHVAVGEIYHTYLKRVAEENLLEKLPRRESEPFAGSRICKDCHSREYRIWERSSHSTALATLEEDHHDRDPDCTGCHVVGLDFKSGFESRAKTPFLSDVGCESCHGPSKAHSIEPYKNKLPKVSESSCASCHVPEHSPGFDFKSYWEKIKH